jgi:hypothetical protein
VQLAPQLVEQHLPMGVETAGRGVLEQPLGPCPAAQLDQSACGFRPEEGAVASKSQLAGGVGALLRKLRSLVDATGLVELVAEIHVGASEIVVGGDLLRD